MPGGEEMLGMSSGRPGIAGWCSSLQVELHRGPAQPGHCCLIRAQFWAEGQPGTITHHTSHITEIECEAA